MRPAGEIRIALRQAACALVAERQGAGATFREIAARANVGLDKARATVKDMVRYGDLQAHGTVHSPHSCKPLVAYVPTQEGKKWSAGRALDCAMRGWAR